MEHSITFERANYGFFNTWTDWHLIPTSRPYVSPPKAKEKYIKIPGTKNYIDLCDSITGFPIYENRTGKWEFMIENGHCDFETLYSQIVDFVNGRKLQATLEDDPGYYYSGRFIVEEPKREPHWSLITISYDVSPYKMYRWSTADDWLWDPFNFETDIIPDSIFRGYEVDGTATLSFADHRLIGRKPVCPVITVDSRDGNPIRVWLRNEELGIEKSWEFSDGVHNESQFILSKVSPNNPLTIVLNGQGTITFDFQKGGL